MPRDRDSFHVWQEVLVRSERLQVTEEVQCVLPLDLERVVLAEGEGLGIEPELQIGGGTPERQGQSAEGGRQPLEVLGRTAVTEVDVVGHAGAAHDGFGLSADDDEFDAMRRQQHAEAFKRTWLGSLVQWPAPEEQPAGRVRLDARVRWG